MSSLGVLSLIVWTLISAHWLCGMMWARYADFLEEVDDRKCRSPLFFAIFLKFVIASQAIATGRFWWRFLFSYRNECVQWTYRLLCIRCWFCLFIFSFEFVFCLAVRNESLTWQYMDIYHAAQMALKPKWPQTKSWGVSGCIDNKMDIVFLIIRAIAWDISKTHPWSMLLPPKIAMVPSTVIFYSCRIKRWL